MHAPAEAPMAGGAAPPYRQNEKLEDVLAYLDRVKLKFVDAPVIYKQFLDIIKRAGGSADGRWRRAPVPPK